MKGKRSKIWVVITTLFSWASLRGFVFLGFVLLYWGIQGALSPRPTVPICGNAVMAKNATCVRSTYRQETETEDRQILNYHETLAAQQEDHDMWPFWIFLAIVLFCWPLWRRMYYKLRPKKLQS
jgi:hypothetical protein